MMFNKDKIATKKSRQVREKHYDYVTVIYLTRSIEVTDECKHCKLRGDINGCLVTDCSKHKDWYAVEQQNRIERLEAAIRTYRDSGITKNQFALFDLLEVGDL